MRLKMVILADKPKYEEWSGEELRKLMDAGIPIAYRDSHPRQIVVSKPRTARRLADVLGHSRFSFREVVAGTEWA